jgi:diaminopropionate ammonia-lyase
MSRFVINPLRKDTPRWEDETAARLHADDALEFHRSLEGYSPTPVQELPELARELGLGSLLVKDESRRFGVKAFKPLGASWAIRQVLARRWREHFGESLPDGIFGNTDRLRSLGRMTFAAASDGNHGRAVAWTARRLGQASVIYMPKGTASARVAMIESEGGRVVVTEGTYDDCVTWIARDAQTNGWVVISDTAYAGYTEIPTWIMQGYTTIFRELEDGPLSDPASPAVDFMLLQAGVGGLAAAGAWQVVQRYGHRRPRLISVEPTAADCFLESVMAGDGEPHAAAGALDSIMAGLDCGVPSTVAWPIIRDAFDLFLAIEDRWAIEAMRRSARESLVSGESGAAGLGGVLALLRDPQLAEARRHLDLGPSSRVLVINTEGDTDPLHYRQVVGATAEEVRAGHRRSG